MKTLVVLDGSLNGRRGNTAVVVNHLLTLLEDHFQIDYIELKDIAYPKELERRLRCANGFVVSSGTYWQSWGSPLQRFLEETTDWEGSSIWLGKPCCIVVTMHSQGGLDLIARLQLNFSLLGTFSPPQCCIAHSYTNQEARKSSQSEDIWDFRYLPAIAHNFMEAMEGSHQYRSWVVDRVHKDDLWIRDEKEVI